MMSPSLAFALGMLVGVMLMCSLVSLYLLIKLFEFIWWISDGFDGESNSN